MVFKAQKDFLYRIVFYSSFLLFIISFIIAINAKEWLTIILMPLLFILFAWLWFGSRYRIGDEQLHIQLGPFKRQISIAKINKIQSKKSILASAALAMDRLEIQYGSYQTIHISPVEQGKFLKKLRQINPNIKVENNLY